LSQSVGMLEPPLTSKRVLKARGLDHHVSHRLDHHPRIKGGGGRRGRKGDWLLDYCLDQNSVCRPLPPLDLSPTSCHIPLPLSPPTPPSCLPPSLSPSSQSVCIFSSSSDRSSRSQTFLRPAGTQKPNRRLADHCDRAAAHAAAPVPPPPALRNHPLPLHRHGRERHMGIKPGGVARMGQAPQPREQCRVR
jgi:hypothetical protein